MRTSLRSTFLGLSLVLSAACSSATPSPGVEGPASGADAGDGAAPSGCAKGLRREGAVCAASLVGFARSDVELGSQRDHHTTHVFVVGGAPYLYVTGGTTGWKGEFSDVVRAKIRDDGGLEAFEEAGSLPLKIAGHSLVRVGDVLVLVGGTTGAVAGSWLARTLAAPIGTVNLTRSCREANFVQMPGGKVGPCAIGRTPYRTEH